MRNDRPKSRPYALRSIGVIVLAGVFLTAPAQAAEVCLVADELTHSGFVGPSAEGLLVPGRGPTVSLEEAERALEGIPRRNPGCTVLIELMLPPPGERPNDRRYPMSIRGDGWDGILASDRTRVPGLISIYDIEPTVEALEAGDEPPITSRRDDVDLAVLDARLDDLDDSRTPAGFGLGAVVAVFALLAALRRSAFFGRAALLAIPTGLSTVLALSALEVSDPWTAVPLLVAVAAGGALVLAALTQHPYALAAALLAIFPVYLIVLAVSQETSSLAMIGPRPENGGRFYGLNNQLETMALAPAFLGAALLGPRLLPFVAALAVVTVGASFAGADGGGVIVLLAGFLFLWLRLRDTPLTARNLALAGAGVVALGLAIVGIDAALGGESHVTRSLGGGPDQVAEDIVDRLRASVAGVASNWHTTLIVAAAIPILVWLALRRPRYAVLDALLVALAVSLLVNDAPREVLGYGALSGLALRYWCENAEAVE
jgi:hypothetical protein